MVSSSDFTVCNLSPSQTARITQPFDHSLIVWIFGKNIRPGQLAGRLRRHLHLSEDVKVFELGLGYFVLNFSETDYLALGGDLPWSIPNLCIYAFPWTPDFKPSEAINSSVHVWIRLQELSIEYYDDEVLKQIAKSIGGDLVKIDPVTKDRRKCKFARICIRLNLCDSLPSMIKLGRKQQEIEYEGLDLLCPNCRFVVDLKHNCLSNPSGCSEFNPHRTPSSSSNQPLIPCESSPASAWGSRFKVLENDPMLDLKLIDDCEKAGTSIRINSQDVPKGKCGNSVQTLPNLPIESSTVAIKAPVLKRAAPSVVEHQFKSAKTSNPILIADQNNQPQPPSPTSTIPSLQPCPASETILQFHSAAIQRSTKTTEITNTPSKDINVDSCPTIYTIDSKKIASFTITLSEAQTRTTTVSNQNQYVVDIVPTLRDGAGSEAVSGSEASSKKMLFWKFPRMDNAKLMRALKDLNRLHEPSIVLIFGTKISDADADQVVQELAFCRSCFRKLDGYNGGVWLLLSKQDVQIEINSYIPQQVSASIYFGSKTNVSALIPSKVEIESSSGPWGSTFFYTSTNRMSSVAY